MSFDLSALKLSVDTSQLDEAITKLNKLQQATSKVEQEVKKQGKASKDSSEEQGKSATKAEKLVDKLKQTYEDLSNEFTRGESAVLRYARSLGVSGQQMQVIIGYLQNIKKLSKDPFDDSIGSVRRIQREYEELTNRTNLLAKGIALTAKQAREYSKLSDEIAGKMQAQKLDPVGKDAAVYSERLAKAQEEYLSYVKRVSDLKKQESPVVQSKSTVATTSPAMDMHVLMYRKQQVELDKLNSAMDSHVAKFYKAEQSKANTVKTVTEQAASDYDQHVKMYVANMNKLEAKESKSFNDRLEKLRKFNQRTEDSLKQADITGVTSAPMARAQGVKSALTRMGIASETELLGNPQAQLEVQRAGTNAAKAWELANRQIKSSREMAFAMRQVPMQITDIVVSLAGGQSPFQVLLQQGGQLKDLFGGVKEAAVALGKGLVDSLVSGFRLLVSPIGLAITAMTLFGTAIYQGADWTERINKSLILLGTSAKQTYSDIYSSSKQIAKETDVGLSAAAEAYMELSKATGLTGNSLIELTKTAVNFEKYGGASIKETSEMLKNLNKDPLKAIEDITNKGYGFMTPAIYKNILALLEQGKAIDAGKLAMQSFEEYQKKAADSLKDNLGYLPTLWNTIKEAATNAWNAMMGWGAKRPNEQAIADLEAAIPKMSPLEASYAKERLAKMKASLPQNDNASAEDRMRIMREDFAASNQKKDLEFAALRSRALADLSKGLRTPEQTTAYLQGMVREIYGDRGPGEKEYKPKKEKTFGVEFGARGGYDDFMKKRLEDEYKMLDAQKKLEKQGSNLLADYRLQTKEQLDQLQIKSQVLGMSAEEKFVEEAKLKALEQYQRIRERILQQMPEGTEQTKALNSAEAQYNQTKQLVESQARLYYQNMESFSTGWDKTYEKYKQSSMTAAAFAEQAFTKMADGMTDAIVQFVTTGKISFSNLTQSILTDILRIQIRSQVLGFLGDSKGAPAGIIGSLAGMLGIGSSASSFASSAFSNLGSGLSLSSFPTGGGLAFANGGAFSQQGLHAFANGGVFTNSIVSSPTLFKFANGGKFGLMGEAGPEAVMPLSRDSSGRLGVVANGGSSAGVQVVINNMGTSSTVTEQKETVDSRGNRRIELTIADAVASEQARPGSKLYNSTRNSFGLKPALVGR